MDKKIKFAKLVAKTGTFFGAVDGNYDDNEKAFVNLFIGLLKSEANIDSDVEKILAETADEKYTLDDIVSETKAHLADMNDAERKETLNSLVEFITIMLNVDGKKASSEIIAFEEWKKAFQL